MGGNIKGIEMEDKRWIDPRLLTVEEAGRYLSISPRTIYNQVSGKRFPIKPLRVGRSLRFDRYDLDKYIESLKTHG
jgi:excisionase family DNA binding protein